MFKRFTINYALFSIALDITLTLLTLHLAGILRPLLPATLPFMVPLAAIDVPSPLYFAVPIIWGIIFPLFSVYDPKRTYRVTDEFLTTTLATGLAALVFMGILYIGFRDLSRWLVLLFLVTDLIVLLLWRIVARIWFRLAESQPSEKRILIVGAGSVGQHVVQLMQEEGNRWLTVIGYVDNGRPSPQTDTLPLLGSLHNVRTIVQERHIDDVIIALPHQAYEELSKLVWQLQDLAVNVRIVPDYFSLALYRASAEEFGGVPMINLRSPALNDVQRFMKRILDIAISTFLITLTSPIMLAVALAIKMDSEGEILFRQKRVGENGRIFGMYKFRSMVPNAEALQPQMNQLDEAGHLVFKFRDDPRITRVGRFIRRTSLDELPQFFNVLFGDMSLVGPRPELPWLVEKYEPWQMKRFAVPQGITGWWQVNGRSDKPMHLNTEEDIYYVQNYSLWMDIYILLKTPWVVLRGKGAY
ncbi:MAG: sugar transferase [Chloroflexi bacterium]|nr:sugar transferase [Chloroflexota bacterium]